MEVENQKKCFIYLIVSPTSRTDKTIGSGNTITYADPGICLFVCCLMVFSATFNNISVIGAVGVIGGGNRGPGENHRSVTNH